MKNHMNTATAREALAALIESRDPRTDARALTLATLAEAKHTADEAKRTADEAAEAARKADAAAVTLGTLDALKAEALADDIDEARDEARDRAARTADRAEALDRAAYAADRRAAEAAEALAALTAARRAADATDRAARRPRISREALAAVIPTAPTATRPTSTEYAADLEPDALAEAVEAVTAATFARFTEADEARTAEAARKADALKREAADALAEARTLTAEAAALDESDPDRRAAVILATAARARSDAAAARAEAAAATLRAARAEAVTLGGDDIIIAGRFATEADAAAKRTAAALKAAREALAEAEALKAAATDARRKAAPADRDAARTAEADAAAAVKARRADLDAARTADRAAREAADEAAEAAPRYAATLAAPVNPADPAAVIVPARLFALDLADALDAVAPTADAPAPAVYFNIYAHREYIEAAARHISRRTARNAVLREGTPAQWRIDADARARRWDAPDLSAMTDAALVTLATATADADGVEKARREAADLADLARDLAALNPFSFLIERDARAARTAAAVTLADATADAAHDKREADALALAVEAADLAADATDAADLADALGAAYHAAFMEINGYLSDARAIRIEYAPPALSLDALDADAADLAALAPDLDPDALDRAEAAEADRAALRAIFADAVPTFTPVQLEIFRDFGRGYSLNQIAARRHRDKKTVIEHRAALARKIADTAAARRDALAPSLTLAALIAEISTATTARAAREAVEAATAARKAARKKAEAAEALKAEALDRAALAAALDKAAEAMTDATRAVYRAALAGRGARETARDLGRDDKTIREHRKRAFDIIAAAILRDAPAVKIPAAIVEARDLAALLAAVKA